MNKIVELLEKKATELRSAISPKSDESWDLTKAAAIKQLEENGVDNAEELIDGIAKEAGFVETQASIGSFPIDADEVITLIEKTAAYIGELQVKIDAKDSEISELTGELEKAASQTDEEIIERLTGKGFSQEELENLRSLPSDVLTKVAYMNSDESPWEMGHGARQAEDSMDPMLKFLTS